MVLTKTSIFLAQATSARLRSFPAATSRRLKSDELLIPAERRSQRSGVQGMTQPFTPALDVPGAIVLATVVIIGRKPRERSSLLPGNLADLGHAHQNGDGSREPNAVACC